MKTASHSVVDFFKGSDSGYSAAPAKVGKPESGKSTLKARINSAVSKVWDFLATDNAAPQVEQKFDRFGYAYWRVYDPRTSQTSYFETDTEVRRWLEQRYYQ